MKFAALVLLCLVFFAAPSVSNGSQADQGPFSRPATVTVVIDPGHPSETSRGTSAGDGTTEIDVNWKMACRLADRLRAVGGIQVILTKNHRLEFVTNRRRAEIANEGNACLLLRLHCDAGRGQGYTLYFPDRAGTRDGVTGPSKEVCLASAGAAAVIHKALQKHLKGILTDNGIKSDSQTFVGSKQGALTGSIHTKVPVVTVEMFYMSSLSDMKSYTTGKAGQALEEALTEAVLQYSKNFIAKN